jgi:hypothetical protein
MINVFHSRYDIQLVRPQPADELHRGDKATAVVAIQQRYPRIRTIGLRKTVKILPK